ncbi:hypothetical protein [Pseudomonas sp.]|uniref:hypothetical protein n=1 Tax=Pseudomonas sp. TaxID=306 RepID=UPI0032636035
MSADDDYYEAIGRLERDEPERLPKGTLINNDTVALEAGRKRGSIKRLRHPDLCKAIDEAAQRQRTDISAVRVSTVDNVKHPESADLILREQHKALENDYKAALQKNVSLVYEVYSLRKKVAQLEREKNVVDFPKR